MLNTNWKNLYQECQNIMAMIQPSFFDDLTSTIFLSLFSLVAGIFVILGVHTMIQGIWKRSLFGVVVGFIFASISGVLSVFAFLLTKPTPITKAYVITLGNCKKTVEGEDYLIEGDEIETYKITSQGLIDEQTPRQTHYV